MIWLRFLIDECGANVNVFDARKRTPLHCVVSSESSFEMVKFLLDHAATVDALTLDDRTPLHIIVAAESSLSEKEVRLKIARLLLERGANVNAKASIGIGPRHDRQVGMTPLHYAVYNNDVKMVELLLAFGADKNQKSYLREGVHLREAQSPLECARAMEHTYRRRPEILEILNLLSKTET